MTEHDALRVALYRRVSSEEQRKHGYSLADQTRELRDEAAKRGWRIVEEIADEGLSGADPYRPGLTRIMELARAGEIDFAVAINRSRWFRDIYVRRGFEQDLKRYGAEIRALDDTGNLIADGVTDLLGENQRKAIAKETKRGRMQRARSGRVVAGVPPYGFAFNEDKTNFVVNAETMPNVRRVFAMAAAGTSLNGIKNALQEDGVPTPSGRGTARLWSRATIRQMILDDAYYPHDREELEGLVEEGILNRDVFSSLAPGPHGIWWFNRVHAESYYDPELEKKRRMFRENPREEWVAVPIPESGVPQARVRQARERIEGNRVPSGAGRRFWELSGGILLCKCGRRMATHTAPRKSGQSFYYVCGLRRSNHETCEHGAKYHRAEDIEARLRAFTIWLLQNPDTMREQVNKQLDVERAALATSGRAVAGVQKKLDEIKHERDGMISLAARGLIDDEDLKRQLSALDERRDILSEELARVVDHTGRQKRLEKVAALVEAYLRDLPELMGREFVVREYETLPEERTEDNPLGAYRLTPENIRHLPEEELAEKRRAAEEERGRRFRDLYEDLGLRATLDRDGTLEISWGGGGDGTHVALRQRIDAESSQQPTWPQERHSRRCTQVSPSLRHSSQPFALGCTAWIWSRCVQLVAITSASLCTLTRAPRRRGSLQAPGRAPPPPPASQPGLSPRSGPPPR